MKSKGLVYTYGLIVLAYIAVVLFLPLDPATLERYSLSEINLRLLSLGIALPLSAIWLMSLYGFIRFRNYAKSIEHEKEGQAYAALARGLMILSFSLPLNSLLTSVLNYIALKNPGFADTSIIIRNYSSLLYQMAAFYILSRGAAGLLMSLKPKIKIFHTHWSIGGIILFSSIFTWLIAAEPFGGKVEDTYHLPGVVVLLTLVIPYLFTWYAGLMAAHRLNVFNRKVTGETYKKILVKLVAGICVIISLSIFIQVIVAFSERLTRLNFTPLLTLIYILLLGYVVGFGLVAKGASDLKRVEEV